MVKSFFWVTLSEIIYNLSAYVIHAVMGRVLGPSDYGRYGIVITLTTMIVVLIGQGVPTAMSKYLSEIFETQQGLIPVIKKQTARIQIILIGVVTVIFFLLTPLIARVLGDSTLTPLFQISTLVIPAFALASFYFYYYTGLHLFNKQAILKTSRSFARIIFILGFAWLLKSRGMALQGAIIGYILAPLSIFFEANFFDPYKKIKAGGFFDWRKLVKYAWPMTLFLIAYEFMITIDLYLVKGLLKSDYLTGIYNGAITVGRIPYFLFYALTIIILPAVSKSTSSNNDKETKTLVSESLRLMVMFLVPLSILMSVFSPSIIRVFYSAKYLDAALPMSILMSGVTFLTVFYFLAFALNGAGKVKIPMVISFVGLALNVIFSFIFIKKYALMGAALATSVTSFITMLLALIYTYRYFGYLFEMKRFIKIILASAVMYFAALLFPQGKLTFILWSAILILFYVFLLYAMKELGSSDVQIIRQLIKRKNKNKVEFEKEEIEER